MADGKKTHLMNRQAMGAFFSFLFFPAALFSFTLEPWYPNVAECHSQLKWAFRSYPSIQSKGSRSKFLLRDQLVHLNGGMQFWPNWEVQVQSDFLKTNPRHWILERVGVQLRTLLLNDVSGDPISLSIGVQSYYVPTRALQNVYSPYHAWGNVELGLSMGKELGQMEDTSIFRLFWFLGLGTANRGRPWIRPLVSFEVNFLEKGKLALFSEGSFGFGHSREVVLTHFNGYGAIAHRSIDCGLHYTYPLGPWGRVRFQYLRRVHAVLFPAQVQSFQIEYRLPFSLF